MLTSAAPPPLETTPSSNTSLPFPVAETDALRAVRDLLNQDVKKLNTYAVRHARGLLLSGPPGVGKTHSVGQAARERGMDVWMVVPGPQASGRLREALKLHAKRECIIFIDEMDEVVGKDMGMVGIVRQILDDANFKAYIIGATNRANAIDVSLLRAGRMDRHVNLGALNEHQRFDILKALCNEKTDGLNSGILRKVARMTPGYVVGDLQALVSRMSNALNNIGHGDDLLKKWQMEIQAGPTPAILRTSLTVPVSGDQGWDMICGNTKAKQELQRAIEWPLKYSDTYNRLNLTRPRGILLHGPPGCAKTTLVRAAAQRASIPLLRMTAADVYSSYVGDSERIVRDTFATARAAAPALLFLDEIDALAMRREQQQQDAEGNQVQQRVLTTLLTEMDGLSTSSMSGHQQDDGVVVVAATNRVDVIDDAILRPGRFDVLIHIELPNFEERLHMLHVFSKELSLSDCVNLEVIAGRTDGKSGAHLKGLCEQAAVAALREHILLMDKGTDVQGEETGEVGDDKVDEVEGRYGPTILVEFSPDPFPLPPYALNNVDDSAPYLDFLKCNVDKAMCSPSQSTNLSDEQSGAQSSRRPRSGNSRPSAHHPANAAVDNSSLSPRWNGPIGWSVYFPETMETDPACKGRADVVSMVKRAFLADERFRTLLTLPAYSTAFSLDFKLLSARTSPAALRKIAMALHLNPTLVLASLGLAACRAAEDLLDDTVAEVSHSTKLCVRIRNFSQLTPLRLLKGSSVGTFVAVCGTVLRVSTIRQQLISMQFRCVRCGEDQTVSFPDYNYKIPTGCPTERCRSRTFTPLHKTAVTADWQKIRVQELQQRDQGDSEGEGMEEGRIPRTIDTELFGDLLDSCVPGDIATVCGIVKVMALNQSGGGQQHGAKGAQSLYYMYIEANSICTTRSRAGAIDADAPAAATVHSVIHEIVREEDPFGFLVHSAVPSIFGHELVKAGLLLALFGGAPRSHKPMVANARAERSDSGKDDDASGDEDDTNQQSGSGNALSSINEDVKIRRNAHVLVVGDPGLGKSQMLKAFCNVAPRGVYVCGTTSSTTGLTVTVVREPSGDFALEAGALVLGDGGVCCIDEFDKMTSEHGALLEAMEQQSVSVAKAGLLCNLSARTTVLAAANPVGGNYDRSKTVCENLKMARPLLSRFDLVFILMDRADAQRDRFISEHVMRTFARRGRPQRGRSGWERRAAGQHNSQPYMACTAAAWRGSTRAGLCADADEDKDGRRKTTAAAAAAAATTQAQAAALAGEGDKDRNQLEQRLQQMRVRDPLPPSLFREYVSYARTHVHPTLSRGSKRVLQDFYRELRKIAKDQAADTTPVTTRQLESMIRLAEARARSVMRTVVTAADAKDVVEIMRKCMVVELSDDMGGIDFGRTSGMSKAAEARRFTAKLNAESKRTNKAKFSDADLKRIGDAIGLAGKTLSDVIESINCQGMLLKKGGGMWALQM